MSFLENKASLDLIVGSSDPNAKTVVRDYKGRQIDQEKELNKLKEQREKENNKTLEWGRGLVQDRQREYSKLEQERESKKPFARRRDDEDMNAMLVQQERWGDPLLQMKAKDESTSNKNTSDDKKIPEKKKRVERPLYKGEPFRNRFAIKPGYRWDGIDRSNGWEEKISLHQNSKKLNVHTAYKWSSEDM